MKLRMPERHAGCPHENPGELIPVSRERADGSRYDEVRCHACGHCPDWTYVSSQNYGSRLRIPLKRRLFRASINVEPDSPLAFDYLALRSMCAHHNLFSEEEIHGD